MIKFCFWNIDIFQAVRVRINYFSWLVVVHNSCNWNSHSKERYFLQKEIRMMKTSTDACKVSSGYAHLLFSEVKLWQVGLGLWLSTVFQKIFPIILQNQKRKIIICLRLVISHSSYLTLFIFFNIHFLVGTNILPCMSRLWKYLKHS